MAEGPAAASVPGVDGVCVYSGAGAVVSAASGVEVLACAVRVKLAITVFAALVWIRDGSSVGDAATAPQAVKRKGTIRRAISNFVFMGPPRSIRFEQPI